MFAGCGGCGGEADWGRILHDEGVPWHEACRLAYVADRAVANAARYVRQNADAARALAEVQDVPKVAAA